MMRLRGPPRDVAVWLALGLAVREVFSFWTGHPFDLEIWLRNSYYVAHGWNPYSLLPPVPGISFAYTNQVLPSVAYLPLWSLVQAGLYDLYALLPVGGRIGLYFLVKQPPILGDVLLGGLLFSAATRWGAPRAVARRLLAFWMVFPYAILISAIWGQFDSLVACLLLAALLASTMGSRAAWIGLGALLKSLPIIFVPYEFFRASGRRRGIALLALGVPAVFTAAVFAVTGWPVLGLSGTLGSEARGFPQGMTYWILLGLPPLGDFVLGNTFLWTALGLLWVPGILLGGWWAARRFPGEGPDGALQAFLFLTVLLFLLRWTVNEQYLVELLPLLLLDVAVVHPERRGLFHATWVLALAFLVVNNFFLVRFGAPSFAGALAFEFGLQTDPAFLLARGALMDVLAILFSLDLVQLALVVAAPRRGTTPWLVRGLRWTWTGPLRRIRGASPGREG